MQTATHTGPQRHDDKEFKYGVVTHSRNKSPIDSEPNQATSDAKSAQSASFEQRRAALEQEVTAYMQSKGIPLPTEEAQEVIRDAKLWRAHKSKPEVSILYCPNCAEMIFHCCSAAPQPDEASNQSKEPA